MPRVRLVFTLCLLSLSACADMLGNKDAKEPGVAIGTFTLSAQVAESSTCRDVSATFPRPWKFDVKLRRDGKNIYWLASSSSVTGTLADDGSLSFSTGLEIRLREADRKRGVGACVVSRTDTFSGNLDEKSKTEATLSGSLTYAYKAVAGSDCRGVVGSEPKVSDPEDPYGVGGATKPEPVMIETLPCLVKLAVTTEKFR